MKLVDEGEYCHYCGEIPEEWSIVDAECAPCHYESDDNDIGSCGCDICLNKSISKIDFMD